MHRHIALNGAKNFRDFGGYPTRDGRTVRRGKLYRADSLSRLDDDDLITLAPIDIHTICDLRRSKEREASPSRWCDGNTIQSLHLPLLLDTTPGNTGTILADARRMNSAEASREIMKATYRRMVMDTHALAQIRRIFLLIADTKSLPLLIHCSGGKDRTGVCCALILTLLEVDSALIMEDYMRSLELYTHRINRTNEGSSQVVDVAYGSPIDEALKPIYSVDPSYLQSAFEAITAQYETPHRFFEEALGLTEANLLAIRSHLLE